MAGLMIYVFAIIVIIPIALIREKLYADKHIEEIDTKKRNTVLFVLRSIFLIIVLALGLFIYKTGYEKHLISSYVREKYELIVYQVGEPDFPFGATYCSLVLNEDGSRTDEMEIAIHNDGKAINAENFDIVWMDKGVSVTTHGEEQDDKTYVLSFDPAAIYTLAKPQEFKANLIEWGKDSFRVMICDPMDNTVFPEGANLTVDFAEGTYFIDLDGSETAYDPHRGLFEPAVEKKLKWVEGMVLQIQFTAYTDFNMDNGYRNHATAERIENVDVIAVDSE